MKARILMVGAAASAGAVLLVACGSSAKTPQVATDSSLEGPATTEASPTTEVPADTVTTAPSSGPIDTAMPLLSAEGVGDLAFGAPQDDAVTTLQAWFGEPSETEYMPECPGGAADIVRWEGFYVTFAFGQFTGWAYGVGAVPAFDLQTDAGITIGSATSDVWSVYGSEYQPEETTLGWELFVGDDYPVLDFFLSGPAGDSTVDALSAGSICAFR